MITAAQLRAARGLLDWTRSDLAKAAKISAETVKNIEHGTFRPQETTAEAIVQAFSMYDVHFTENQGVVIRHEAVTTLQGAEGFRKFIDDVYETAKGLSSVNGVRKLIDVSNVDDRLFTKHLGEYFDRHIRRMNELKDFKMRILIKEKPHSLLPEESKGSSYREYRRHPDQSVGNVPFYVYGNKLGILIFEEDQAPQIVIITSPLVAKTYKEQFEVLWQTAKPLVKN